MNRYAVTTLLAVAALLPAAPAAMAEIALIDSTTTTPSTATPGTTTPGTTKPGTTTPGTTTPCTATAGAATATTTTPCTTTKDPAPDSPIEALVTGSSGFKLGGALGSSNTNSAEPGTCTVMGTASALSGLAALGCGPDGPGTVG
ncbi:hypothetical protein ACFXO9_13180 [Nocardia tengchongensis]|uniref:hypothetical protein n=1 Tax=Nocardia tengchongensis TaxID=2055889 RepID=UPI0036AD3DAC